MSTLQSAHQHGKNSWPMQIREEGGSIETQREERREAKKRKRSKNISMQCQGCGNEFFLAQRRGKFCSHQCYAQKSRTTTNAIPCMICLRSLGFGLKAVARQMGKHHAAIRTALIRSGNYSVSGDTKRAANREVLSCKINRTGHIGSTARIAKPRSSITRSLTPIQKTRRILRQQIKRLIEMIKCDRQFRTEEYVGCSFEDAKRAIEEKFIDGMSWDNYGTEWELDHIQPMSSFDLSNPNQVMMVNHISNLQPMNPSLNRSKGNKIIPKKITRLLS